MAENLISPRIEYRKIDMYFSYKEGANTGKYITLVPIVLYLRYLISWLKNIRYFYRILIGGFKTSSVQKFQVIILIYRRGNFDNEIIYPPIIINKIIVISRKVLKT